MHSLYLIPITIIRRIQQAVDHDGRPTMFLLGHYFRTSTYFRITPFAGCWKEAKREWVQFESLGMWKKW
jgi:hypothetical protein